MQHIVFLISTLFTALSIAAPSSNVALKASMLMQADSKHLVVSLIHGKNWHTYWKNPGDAGLPPKFTFSIEDETGSESLDLSSLEWPVPKRFIQPGNIFSYGYEGIVHFYFPVGNKTIENLKGKRLKIHGEWLACHDICLPGQGEAFLDVGLNGQVSPAASFSHAVLLNSLAILPKKAKLPERMEIYLTKKSEKQLVLQYTLQGVDPSKLDSERNLLTPFLAVPLTFKKEKLYFDEESKKLYGIMEADWDGEYEDPERPLPQDGVLFPALATRFLFSPQNGTTQVIEKSFDNFSVSGYKAVENYLSTLTPLTPPTADPSGRPKNQPAEEKTNPLWLILFFGFLGGAILNLMPCVLPVISLKLFGLINHSKKSGNTILKHNLAYSAGVLLTFSVLAAFISFLKFTGQEVGWGFQMQSPHFVLVMMLATFVMALNMFGLFEFGTPGGSIVGNFRTKEGFTGDFFNGVLAVVLSTPCSAPFLGAALTFAFTTSYINIFLILSSVGLGLTLPFLLTGFFPRLVFFLPKPGDWMEHLKRFLGLSLLLTFLWLHTILASLIAYNSVALIIQAAFLMIFFGFYFRKRISKRPVPGILFFFIPWVLIGVLIQSPFFANRNDREKIPVSVDGTDASWKPWSSDAMKSSLGEWTFIDFTADWCLTCKVNEKLVLHTDEFNRLVREKNIQLLLGDWTRRDDKITSFLKRNGLVAVPAYFLQDPKGNLINLGETISIDKIKSTIESR